MSNDGALMFARYAYPPNSLGYCGPDDPDALLDQVAAQVVDGALRQAAQSFEGAWPYLELIAHCNGIADPLTRDVVEAYWLGNAMLDRVTMRALGESFEERFRVRAGRAWSDVLEGVAAGGRPHHNFHVFGVYPWLGLMRTGIVDQPLRVLDHCRIRWGRVLGIDGDNALVSSQPLQWDGKRLHLGDPRPEHVVIAAAGRRLATDATPGDWCALHWNWVCDRLTRRQAQNLRYETQAALNVVNQMARPAPAVVLT